MRYDTIHVQYTPQWLFLSEGIRVWPRPFSQELAATPHLPTFPHTPTISSTYTSTHPSARTNAAMKHHCSSLACCRCCSVISGALPSVSPPHPHPPLLALVSPFSYTSGGRCPHLLENTKEFCCLAAASTSRSLLVSSNATPRNNHTHTHTHTAPFPVPISRDVALPVKARSFTLPSHRKEHYSDEPPLPPLSSSPTSFHPPALLPMWSRSHSSPVPVGVPLRHRSSTVFASSTTHSFILRFFSQAKPACLFACVHWPGCE